MCSRPALNRPLKRLHTAEWTQRGFTHLELLLVLSVILLNVAIFLPHLQLARESARQHRCRHNLKQIGLAIHSYHDSCGCFPAGFDVPGEGDYLGWGWNVKILPYMNAADLYAAVQPRFAGGIHSLADLPEVRRRVSELCCPSDAASQTVPHAMVVNSQVVDRIVSPATDDWRYRLPHSSYFGNAGYLQIEAGGIQYNAAGIPTSIVPLINAGSLGNFGTDPSPDHRYCDQKYFGGYFGQNSHVTMREVKDGTSNTILVGERYSPTGSSASAVGHGTWIGVPDCTRAQGLAMALADASVRMNIGMPLREETTGFGSLHQGGAFFGLGDGSARFLSHEIDMVAFRNLAFIDDGSR